MKMNLSGNLLETEIASPEIYQPWARKRRSDGPRTSKVATGRDTPEAQREGFTPSLRKSNVSSGAKNSSAQVVLKQAVAQGEAKRDQT